MYAGKRLYYNSFHSEVKGSQSRVFSRRALTVVCAADYNALSETHCALRESVVAYGKAVFGYSGNVRAEREYLCACRHDVVGRDVVACLERAFGCDAVGKRSGFRISLDVRSAEYFDFFRFVRRCGRSYHVVVHGVFFGEYKFGHIAKLSRVAEVSRNSRRRRNFGRDKVYLRVLCSASAFKVSVERSERDSAGVR